MRTFFNFLLTLVFAAFSVFAFAGGPTPAEPPAPAPEKTGVYVDLSAGYASVHWGSFIASAFNAFVTPGSVNSNPNGGVTFGFDVGYQINNFLGLETGWYYLPEVKGEGDIFNPDATSLRLESWLAYLALKIMVPLTDRFDVFAKAGLGYRSLNWKGNGASVAGFGDRDTDYFSGVLGAGLQYWFDENLSVSVQYLYMMSNTSGSQVSKHAPAVNLILASVAYIFAV